MIGLGRLVMAGTVQCAAQRVPQRVPQRVRQRVSKRWLRRGLTLMGCVAWSSAIIACGDGRQPATDAAADSATTIAASSRIRSDSTQSYATCDTTSFTAFWQGFRAAVQSKEITAVRALVSDTFAVRGTLDSDAWVRVGENEFARQWSALLAQDPGLRIEPETLRDYVARADILPAQAVDPSQTTARIADLVFQCADGRWRLSRAYASE